MNVKKRDLIILQQGIVAVADLFGDNVRFSYAIAKNDKLIAPEVEAINKTLQATPEFSEYETKRVDLVKTYAKKDNGEAMMANNNFLFDTPEKKKECEDAVAEFKKPYVEVLGKRDEQIKQYNELLDEPSEVKLYMLNENDLPRTITPAQLARIITIVE